MNRLQYIPADVLSHLTLFLTFRDIVSWGSADRKTQQDVATFKIPRLVMAHIQFIKLKIDQFQPVVKKKEPVVWPVCRAPGIINRTYLKWLKRVAPPDDWVVKQIITTITKHFNGKKDFALMSREESFMAGVWFRVYH